MGILAEFKEFAIKGNVVDMAVGIVIGAAFGKIVASLVKDIIMPPIGLLLGGVNFTDLAVVLKAKTAEAEAVTLNYGAFIQTAVDFLIIAFAIFIAVKAINTMKKKEEACAKDQAPAANKAPSPTNDSNTAATDARYKHGAKQNESMEEMEARHAAERAALEAQGLGCDPIHFLLDLREVLGGDLSIRQVDVVIETVFDDRPDRELCARKQTQDRVGHLMRSRMAQHLEGRCVAFRQDRNVGCVRKRAREVHDLAVHPGRDRGLRQAGADLRGEVGGTRTGL